MSLIPRLRGVEYAGAVPNRPGVPDPGPGGNEYGGEYPVPMTTGGPQVSGIQEYLAKLAAQGAKPTPQNVNRARVGDTSAAPSKSMDVLPSRADRTVEGYEPNPRDAVPQRDPMTLSRDEMSPRIGGNGGTVPPQLPPDVLGSDERSPSISGPGGIGAALGAGGLGALIIKLLSGGGGSAPVIPPITPIGVGGPQGALPAPTPALPPTEMSPRIGGPAIPPVVGGPNPGAPQIAAPGERPPIPMGSVPTGNPPIALPDSNVPPPRLQTAGVDLQRPPASMIAPPGAAAENASLTPSPTSAAISKALEGDKPAPRAKSPRGRARVPRVAP